MRQQFVRLLALVILGAFGFQSVNCSGKQEDGNAGRSERAVPAREPTPSPQPQPSQEPQPATEEPATPPEMPRADIVIMSIDPPAHVGRDVEIPISFTVRNNSQTGPSCDCNVEFRARIDDASGATNLYLGATVFRALNPQELRAVNVTIRSPNRTGLWILQATIQGITCTVPTNSRFEAQLVVD
jgi:hypothetical protein